MFYKQWNAESVFYWEDSCWGLCNWNPSQFTWGEGQWHAALCTHLCSYSGSLLTVDEWLSVGRKLNPGTEVIDKHCYKSTLLDCRCLFCCSCQIVLQPSSAPSNDALNIFFYSKSWSKECFFVFFILFLFDKAKSDLRVFWRKRNRLQILCRRAERKTNTPLSPRVNSSVWAAGRRPNICNCRSRSPPPCTLPPTGLNC